MRLENVEDRYPDAMSGGQQQRAALARAAVYNPLLLVMDEPLSALDKNLREEMQFEIKQLQANVGSTVLYVTHDQSEAAAMAHRIAIMHAGDIIQVGTAKELYRNPRNRFVASFLGQANILDIARSEPGKSGMLVTTSFGLQLTANSTDQPSNASVCIRPEAIVISRDRPSLDNVTKGVVVDTTFTNGVQRHKVGISEGVVLEQWQRMVSGSYSPEVGEVVFLGWDKKDTLIVGNE